MKIECPHCQQHYEVEENMTGRVQCTRCQQEFEIAPESAPKSFWDKVTDVMNTEITLTADPAPQERTAESDNVSSEQRDQLDVDLRLPLCFYFLAFVIALAAFLGVCVAAEKKIPYYGWIICLIIAGGIISGLLLVGLGRLIASGIIMETYLKDLHRHLIEKEKK